MATQRLTADELAEILGERTGHIFRDPKRLQRALTHGSARANHAGVDFQRYEFLGDRVLGLTIADMLFHAFPEAEEGELSRRLNALVNAEALAAIAEEIGLPELIRAGAEMRNLAERKRLNMHADAMESLIAVLYLDGGIEVARAFIHRHWKPRANAATAARRDPKTELQEWAHQAASTTPAYAILSRTGPDHDPVFIVEVKVGKFTPGRGEGRSKREAEQAAATAVLVREGVWKVQETAS